MKERPLIMTQEMVRAERDGRKTMTRRMNGLEKVNDPERIDILEFEELYTDKKGVLWAMFRNALDDEVCRIKCPYGAPGDRFWVKESCYVDNNYLPGLNRPTTVVLYTADRESWSHYEEGLIKNDHMMDVNARFMYKELARTWLEVVEIRVERLLDITEEDALAEGVLYYDDPVLGRRFKDYLAKAKGYGHPDHDYPTLPTAKLSAISLFGKVNKGKQEQALNPWVWVIKFKRVSHERLT